MGACASRCLGRVRTSPSWLTRTTDQYFTPVPFAMHGSESRIEERDAHRARDEHRVCAVLGRDDRADAVVRWATCGATRPTRWAEIAEASLAVKPENSAKTPNRPRPSESVAANSKSRVPRDVWVRPPPPASAKTVCSSGICECGFRSSSRESCGANVWGNRRSEREVDARSVRAEV